MAHRTLFTIGHSTREWGDFVDLLRAWKIQELADVRTVPRSKTFPWFDRACMAIALPEAQIGYRHIANLGGLRTPSKGSPNIGWKNARFQAYADYMQTNDFERGLEDLGASCKERRVCIMCSEAVWWRCHRRMIADAELARGVPVRHIMSLSQAKPHEMTGFARVVRQRGRDPIITYPAPEVERLA